MAGRVQQIKNRRAFDEKATPHREVRVQTQVLNTFAFVRIVYEA